MFETIDPVMIERYKDMARGEANLRGMSTMVHAKSIEKIVRRTNAKTLLDYGSGAGDQYSIGKLHEFWNCEVCQYDPAFEELNQKPNTTFDGVICNDVLEHIAEPQVTQVIAELYHYAEKFIFASVCCRLAKKSWEDGTNLHCTIQSMMWWERKFAEAAKPDILLLLVESP